MKTFILTVTTLLMLAAGTMTAANAVEFGVGPGGVYVGPDRYHYYDRDYGSDCRTIISHRTNRFGEDVVVRRRVCD
ncbi:MULTISPECIES: hypothetical protein [unclassified Bradyrhizobium]|uniref:hypothetical protein n=1 Tax=unclassified Bradyrhizobium TaxID=2631580 RepID=UPI002479C6B8|nr:MULTISPECIES: hypothetical protein [unclassified Bradyrhizobium]WGR73412.1 hypothetical protein MTX24_11600 [Bradyrhizobium sp. ISRA426]WGR78249.1 hypothetical protein MTX21_36570 [Bradyrhizobium sp. ISRA430]WGR88650.1 hypothetical protein MTX25_11610 [Bradyrhizobium sp. ISRA432]